MRKAVRFIYAPQINASQMPDVVLYRVTLTPGVGARATLEARAWPLDTASIWDPLPYGPVDLLIEALDGAGRAIERLERQWHKARPFSEPRALFRSVDDIVRGVARHLIHFRHPNAHEPERHPLFWHATATIDGSYLHEFTYPAWGHGMLIDFFMDFAAACPEQSETAIARRMAGELADALLACRSRPEAALPNLFYSTAVRGANGGQADGDTLMPTMSGNGARSLFRLGTDGRVVRWRRAAWDVALSLLNAQNADGSWPFRVKPDTGLVVKDYTSNSIPVILLWDDLLASTPDPEIESDTPANRAQMIQARKRALVWLMAQPWRDMRWEGFYEDIPNLPAYENMEWFDASLTVQYVLSRPGEFPGELGRAVAIARWIEDQFLCWHPDDVPGLGKGVVPIIPTALEQYRCYLPIDAHVARALDLFMMLWESTGDETYRARAITLAASLEEAQRPGGVISTWMWYDSAEDQRKRALTVPGCCDGDWFRCMAYDATILLRHRQNLDPR